MNDFNLRPFFESVFEQLVDPVLADYPKLDTPIKDFKEEYALPGVKKSELDLIHDGEFLTIKVDSQRIKKTLSVRLPSKYYNVDKIDVKYEDGLLSITVPVLKKEEKKDLKRIELK